jgi:hypothetical protein
MSDRTNKIHFPGRLLADRAETRLQMGTVAGRSGWWLTGCQ